MAKTTKKKTAWSAGSTGTKMKSTARKTKSGTAYKKKPTAAERRSGTGATEKRAPLPVSCHYTKTAAQREAKGLREGGVKARVVSSGKNFCVYTVERCKGKKK